MKKLTCPIHNKNLKEKGCLLCCFTGLKYRARQSGINILFKEAYANFNLILPYGSKFITP